MGGKYLGYDLGSYIWDKSLDVHLNQYRREHALKNDKKYFFPEII